MNMNDVSINIHEIVSGNLTKSILEENADIIEKWFLFYLKDKLIAKQCFRISYDMFIGKENFVIEEGAVF